MGGSRSPKIRVGGIIEHSDLALVGVMSAPDRPGLAGSVFGALGAAGLNAQFIVQSIDLSNHSHIQFLVALGDLARTISALQPVSEALAVERLTQRAPVMQLAVYGPDFRERPGIASAVFGALASVHVNILAVSTSISTVSCVISQDDRDAAMEALRGVLELP
ncbi:MAG: ACT domain-containing protein [Anaerolineae bacterium]|jgi:aspartate kinase